MNKIQSLSSTLLATMISSTALIPLLLCGDFMTEPTASTSPLSSWTQGQLYFTVPLVAETGKKHHDYVLSPLSIQMALALATITAEGNTLKELIDVTGLPEETHVRDTTIQLLLERLNTQMAIGVEPVSSKLVNKVWFENSLIPSPSLETRLQTFYGGYFQQVPFKTSPDLSRQWINDFIALETEDKIRDLLPEGSINDGTKMVLTQALFFRAPWATQFPTENSFEAPFYGLEKSLRPIPYMRLTTKLSYMETGLGTMIELPFKKSLSTDSSYSFYLFLPNENVLLSELEETLSTRKLAHWLDSPWNERLVDLSLPKFKIETDLSLKETLYNMGIHDAFSEEAAEFGFKSEEGRVVITDVIHKAVFEIDETGGLGAAATGITLGTTSWEEPKTVMVNRPFLFFVVENNTKAILFAGKIMQPKSSI